jgi:hypothetical protein
MEANNFFELPFNNLFNYKGELQTFLFKNKFKVGEYSVFADPKSPSHIPKFHGKLTFSELNLEFVVNEDCFKKKDAEQRLARDAMRYFCSNKINNVQPTLSGNKAEMLSTKEPSPIADINECSAFLINELKKGKPLNVSNLMLLSQLLFRLEQLGLKNELKNSGPVDSKVEETKACLLEKSEEKKCLIVSSDMNEYLNLLKCLKLLIHKNSKYDKHVVSVVNCLIATKKALKCLDSTTFNSMNLEIRKFVENLCLVFSKDKVMTVNITSNIARVQIGQNPNSTLSVLYSLKQCLNDNCHFDPLKQVNYNEVRKISLLLIRFFQLALNEAGDSVFKGVEKSFLKKLNSFNFFKSL